MGLKLPLFFFIVAIGTSITYGGNCHGSCDGESSGGKKNRPIQIRIQPNPSGGGSAWCNGNQLIPIPQPIPVPYPVNYPSTSGIGYPSIYNPGSGLTGFPGFGPGNGIISSNGLGGGVIGVPGFGPGNGLIPSNGLGGGVIGVPGFGPGNGLIPPNGLGGGVIGGPGFVPGIGPAYGPGSILPGNLIGYPPGIGVIGGPGYGSGYYPGYCSDYRSKIGRGGSIIIERGRNSGRGSCPWWCRHRGRCC